MYYWKATALLIGLTCGNFSYEALARHDWGSALEHSFFQAIALYAFAFFLNIDMKGKEKP
jgi:hypothetical protein